MGGSLLSSQGSPFAPSASRNSTPAQGPYSLSPMQAGMLYRSLLGENGTGDGYDIEQMHGVVAEQLRVEACARAWTLVARRHSTLSTSFPWGGVAGPRQRAETDVFVAV